MHAVAEDMAPTNLLQIQSSTDVANMTKTTNSNDDLAWQTYELTRSKTQHNTTKTDSALDAENTEIWKRWLYSVYLMDIFKIIA